MATAWVSIDASAQSKGAVGESDDPDNNMSLQLNGSFMSLSGAPDDPDGGLFWGGTSLTYAWDIFGWCGLELGAGLYQLLDETQAFRLFGSIAWRWYVLNERDYRLYLVTGVSSISEDEGGLTFGLGGEWTLSPSWSLSAEARMAAYGVKEEEADPEYGEYEGQTELQSAAMFNLGIVYRF